MKKFKDDSFGFDKGKEEVNLPRKPRGGKSDYEGVSLPQPTAQPMPKRPVKKVNLGAAATYGQDASKTQTEAKMHSTKNNNMILEDLFSDSHPKVGQVDHMVDNNESFDDFDPRAGELTNGMVGGYDALASDNNNISKVNADDDFADFLSAFSGGGSSALAPASNDIDLFGGLLMAASAGPTPEVDLFAGFTSAPAPTPSSNLDLFSGMQAAPAPVTPGFGAFGSAAPVGPGLASLDLLDGLSLSSLPPPAMSHQPPPLLLSQGPPSLPTTSALPSKPAAAPAIGATWGDLGSLNNSLINFSLTSSPTTKAPAVPMNAIKMQQAQSVPQPSNGTNNNMAVGGFSGLDGLL